MFQHKMMQHIDFEVRWQAGADFTETIEILEGF